MIYIALGSNLPSARFGAPLDTLNAAVDAIERSGIHVVKHSRWYRSPAYPPSDQPDFVNGVIAVETLLPPAALLTRLHAIEASFGRERQEQNAARTLDLDLIAYDDVACAGADNEPALPHPRMVGRAFVLRPLQDIAPDWRHPLTGETISALIAALPPDQRAEVLENGAK
ncbi:MAG TPA: 2-amino-4-hydroxy-6-hydroxymethyldihydropteridine diphosphokinase [Alphaproteobacteria bacterium]|nr:2-amino-4-hydroxy-6-hydroxymethyldihydropteridine diphosphokinase [Alphaproteobacteria bacterium]